MQRAEVQKAIAWLKGIQNLDGGWGEAGESYALDYSAINPRQARRRRRHGHCLP
jgi:hypothetical protein